MALAAKQSTVDEWVNRLQASGRYTFSRAEALADSGPKPEAVKKALQRLVARGRVAKVKEYFFVIVPLEYLSAGGPPPAWYIDDLMAAMNRPYYVGLLTAAGQLGSAHHAAQQFQVITHRPIRSISVGRAAIHFYASRFVTDAAILSVKTPTGAMRVSTTETTAVDLVRFAKSVGSLDHAATVIGDLVEQLDGKKLAAAAKLVGDLPNAQRLGYVLDTLGARRLTDPLRAWVARQTPHVIPLHSHYRGSMPNSNPRWQVYVDRKLELDR